MEKEEKINNYIERTLRHSQEVCNFLFILTKHLNELSFNVDRYELLKRAVNHDIDKVCKSHVESIIDVNDTDSQISQNRINEAREIIDIHYSVNKHHTKYHIKNDIPLSNKDICEMCCDWISSHRKDSINLVETATNMKNQYDEYLKKHKENNAKEYLFYLSYREKFFEVYDLLAKINVIKE